MIAVRPRLSWLWLVAAGLLTISCGKKGPPLPPLIQLPAAPGDLTVTRRGTDVDVSFRVPKSNTDGVTPATIGRVDVFALTLPESATADEVIRRGARIASVTVNEPLDPDEPPPPDDAPKGKGADQDSIATVTETLDAASASGVRSYVAVGFNPRGRRGAVPEGVPLPLIAAPAAPGQPAVTYDEEAVTISWAPVDAESVQGVRRYVVFQGDDLLTSDPIDVPRFVQKDVKWNEERCYVVNVLSIVGSARILGEPSLPTCVTLKDTFPPDAPEGLVGVASEGAISLIWNPSSEADLLGYLVLRAIAPSTQLVPVTPLPMIDTNFRDAVAAGSRVTYAIQAIDKAGNRSKPSVSITETAR